MAKGADDPDCSAGVHSINELFAEEPEQDNAEGKNPYRALLDAHQAQFPLNREFRPTYDHGLDESDAVRLGRWQKAIEDAEGLSIHQQKSGYTALNRDHDDPDLLILEGVPARGSLQGAFYVVLPRARSDRAVLAAKLQSSLRMFGINTVVTLDHNLYNPGGSSGQDPYSERWQDLCALELSPVSLDARAAVMAETVLEGYDKLPKSEHADMPYWLGAGFALDEIEAWRAATKPFHDARSTASGASNWHAAGHGIDTMKEWAAESWAFSQYFFARPWISAGVPSHVAGLWAAHGLHLYRHAEAYIDANVEPDTAGIIIRASGWKNGGSHLLNTFSADEIVKLHRAGFQGKSMDKLITWIDQDKTLGRDKLIAWALAGGPNTAGPGRRAKLLKAGVDEIRLAELSERMITASLVVQRPSVQDVLEAHRRSGPE